MKVNWLRKVHPLYTTFVARMTQKEHGQGQAFRAISVLWLTVRTPETWHTETIFLTTVAIRSALPAVQFDHDPIMRIRLFLSKMS